MTYLTTAKLGFRVVPVRAEPPAVPRRTLGPAVDEAIEAARKVS